MTSSFRVANLKRDMFECSIFPQSPTVLAFVCAKLWRGGGGGGGGGEVSASRFQWTNKRTSQDRVN